MYVRKAVLFLFLLSDWCSASTRIWYRKISCGKTGFTCFPKIGPKKTLIIECPSRAKEYHIYINEFNGPNTLEYVKIQNCKTLTILFRCSKYKWEKKNLKQLQISNIEKLKFLNVQQFQPALPPIVTFQNIQAIEQIRSYTFTQTNKDMNVASKCVLPDYKLQSLHFQNVSIDTVKANAFFLLNDFVNLTFTDVRIKSLNTGAFFVNQNGVFLLQNSTVNMIEPLAIELDASKVIVSNNTFEEISTNGFKVVSDTFTFTNNSVENFLHSQAMSVVSKNVLISSNRFQYLKSGAFSNIASSRAGFGTLEFSKNKMYFVEDDSLVPDLSAYMDALKQVSFNENYFSCQCWQSDLLLSKIGTEDLSTTTGVFYKALFDEKSRNTCFSNCSLPLGHAKAKIVQGKCNNNITVDDLCEAMMEPTTEVSSTTETSSSTSVSSSSEYSSVDTSFDTTTEVESTSFSGSSSTEVLATDSSPDTSSDVTNENPTEVTTTKPDLKNGKMISALPMSRHALTTATSLKTTVGPTKSVVSTERYVTNDYGMISKSYKEDFSMKSDSMWTRQAFLVAPTNPSSNKTIGSGSNTFFLSSSLVFFCFGFLKVFL